MGLRLLLTLGLHRSAVGGFAALYFLAYYADDWDDGRCLLSLRLQDMNVGLLFRQSCRRMKGGGGDGGGGCGGCVALKPAGVRWRDGGRVCATGCGGANRALPQF